MSVALAKGVTTAIQPTVALAAGISRAYLLRHRICPRATDAAGSLVVAVGVEPSADALEELSRIYGRPCRTEAVTDTELERLVELAATEADRIVALERVSPDEADDERTTDVRDLANQPPVIRYVNLLIRDAHDARASDIHLEAAPDGLRVRLRIDGVLTELPGPPRGYQAAVVSRVKLLAELDIAERRAPQDGRIRVRLEARELDLRISTVPTLHGESVVLRLLDRGGQAVGLDDLGMAPDTLEAFRRLATRPHGILLATGPTGSGKTTTLYAALALRDGGREKVVTVEDPVEYHLPGVTQVPVHAKAGVSFAAALRSILRQDPDVLMVGEMRDAETAGIAVQAAMTGHLVFSTLHTNDALSAIARLTDLRVEPYMVASTVEAVLAQRLVRRVCPECRTRYRPDPAIVALLAQQPVGAITLERGTGCAACRHTGYRGRTGIFELLVLTDACKEAVTRGADAATLRGLARDQGMTSLRADGWRKVQAGMTTVEEVLRVAGE